MVGAIPNRPIIIHALEHSLSLIKNPSQLYSDLSGCSNDDLTEFFTYHPFVEVYIANANRYNTVDIAIPQKLEEQEDFDTLDEELLEKLLGPFKDKVFCSAFNVNIGQDGINGGTWMEMKDFE